MTVLKKPNIRTLRYEELQEYFISKGENSFRARQVYEWIWKKGAHSFDEMSNLSIPLRNKLKEYFAFSAMEIQTTQVSSDGTVKFAFRLFDGNFVEGVLIPSKDRFTACISSQVGCSLECKFCATGKIKRSRNLEADEIYQETFLINTYCLEKLESRLDNIVLMGMGEPLLNYKNVLKGIEMIVSPEGLGMSPQRITLSTAGIAKMIRQLADDKVKFHLALSLHAVSDEKRSRIMPINESNNLAELREALIYFYKKTRTRIFYEYLLLNGFNDSTEDARNLAEFCKITPCKINVIEYNPVEGFEFKKPPKEKTELFLEFLLKRNLKVYYRRSRGRDIDAACGQLANKSLVKSN